MNEMLGRIELAKAHPELKTVAAETGKIELETPPAKPEIQTPDTRNYGEELRQADDAAAGTRIEVGKAADKGAAELEARQQIKEAPDSGENT